MLTMKLTPVKSSNIEAIGHSGTALRVQFKGGKVFEYPGVTAAEFDALHAAPSVGSHFGSHIRSKFKGAEIK